LLGIENNVTKEIAAIKSIAESLSTSSKLNGQTTAGATGAASAGGSGASGTTNGAAGATGNSNRSSLATQQDVMNLERRLLGLETGLNTILTRLDGLGQTISQPHSSSSGSAPLDKKK
jgi:hypothetical protein